MKCKLVLRMDDGVEILTYCEDERTAIDWAQTWKACARVDAAWVSLSPLLDEDGVPLLGCLPAKHIFQVRCTVGVPHGRSGWRWSRPGLYVEWPLPPEPTERVTYAQWLERQGGKL